MVDYQTVLDIILGTDTDWECLSDSQMPTWLYVARVLLQGLGAEKQNEIITLLKAVYVMIYINIINTKPRISKQFVYYIQHNLKTW